MKRNNLKTLLITGLTFAFIFSCGKNSGEGVSNPPNEHSDEHEHSEEIVLTEAQMKAVDIKLGRIEMRDLNSTVRVNGQLALDPQKRAEITSLTNGIIRQVMVTEGKFVSAGQTVAFLENTEIVELQKNYLVQKKEALTAEQEYSRQRDLSAQGAGVEKSLQKATANREITRAQMAGLEKQLRQLGISPEKVSSGELATQIPLKAPISGYVDKINVCTGSYADTRTALMNVVDNSQMHCDLNVFEKDIQKVRVGQEVDIQLTNQPAVPIKTVIYNINKSLEESTKSIIVHSKITSKGDADIYAGMYVTGLINTGLKKTQAVPDDAIVSREGKKYIFVMEDDDEGEHSHSGEFRFSAAEVITGVSELGYTQITPAGELPEDATVVTANAFYLGSMSADHGEHNH
ncbi:MAG: efflux RND transporter periplasmic adaptor subunit [Dysgonamonadaceae bacterium]|nr:efflux RND transporter periplasmic adaptor subunit [Dysgonamonadaceae bacterium]